MEKNNDIMLALQKSLDNGTLDLDDADNILEVVRKEKEKKEKERKVLEKHNYKIRGPYKSRNREIWQTHAPWLQSKNLNRQSREELIDALYQHYFGNDDKENLLRTTVQQVFDKMMAEYEQNKIVSFLTLVHYRADWKKYLVDKNCRWLDSPIKDVLPEQVFEHYKLITANCAIKRKAFDNVKTIVNEVFGYAYTHNIPCIRTKNISTSKLRFAPVEDKWEGVYTDLDRQKILKACEKMKPTVYIKAIELMFCLDVRIGELRALYKEDVDLDAKEIFIGHQMIDVKTDKVNRHSERTNIMKGKAEAGKRTQPLSKHAVEVIEWLLETYPNTPWLLPSKKQETPIRAHRFNDNLKRVCEKAGVKYFSSHGIRFHNISALYDAGVDEKDIQRMSGHTTVNMTRHYNKSIKASNDAKIREVLG